MTTAAETSALRLATAKAVNWLAKPLNRLTLWAARVVIEDRLTRLDKDES